jgi:hypothetical protein
MLALLLWALSLWAKPAHRRIELKVMLRAHDLHCKLEGGAEVALDGVCHHVGYSGVDSKEP